MKLKTNHPAPSEREASGPRYWRSLDELSSTPAFKDWLDKEFPAGASMLEGNDRRNFLKVMAASFGLAGLGLAGCRQQTRHLLPYSKQPDRIIPGVPVFYASSLPGADESIPLIVETHDARPTKVEGNPSYKLMGGATNVHAQSSILDLYDPDRAQRSSGPGGVPMSSAQAIDALKKISSDYSANQGEGLYFLADKSNSPTRNALAKNLQGKFPKAVWAEFEAVDQSNRERAAAAYLGKNVRPIYNFSKATRVLALESDFLHSEPGHLANAKGFAQARRIQNGTDADPEKMIRLYAIESNFSLTGANADHRLRVPTAQIMGVTALVAAEIFTQLGKTMPQSAVDALKQAGAGIKVDAKWITECAKDLIAHAGKSAIIAGPQLPVELHSLVLLMNAALGAGGTTISLAELPEQNAAASLADVVKAIDAGSVKTLFILNGNPVYNAPGDVAFAVKLDKLKAAKGQVIRYGYYGRQADETSAQADVFIAGLHYLESWSDGLTWDGYYVPVQPMILPLFEGHSELEVLGTLMGDAKADAYGYVRATFDSKQLEKSFEEWLAVGVAGAGFTVVTGGFTLNNAEGILAAAAKFTAPVVDDSHLEVRLVPGITFDGRFANNGWLQECPDPMTKLTWDNAIFISPKLAKQKFPELLPGGTAMSKGPLGLLTPQARVNDNNFETGREIAQVAEITVNGKTIKGPVSILPGLADYTVVIPLGYGRKIAGSIGTKTGFDAFPIVSSTGTMSCSATGATMKLTGETYRLANVQEHWSMEGRAIIREASVDDYKAHPEFVKEMDVEAHSPAIYGKDQNMSPQDKATKLPRGQSLYDTHPNNQPAPNVAVWNTPENKPDFPTPQQWGMSIDLNTCLGCTACLVACQAENNIPIVGKDQVMRGREMHWIRLDRYFASGPVKDASGNEVYTDAGDLPEDPQVNFQSVACQHCEFAPCENVCPFMATLHDDSGLNIMAYNRCVGTKYCANNCPYKVRRFNFFDWNKREIGEFYKGPLGPDFYDTDASQLTRMQKNPDVSVRMRGVMEKCTYCVQRIEAAKINARVKARDSGDTKVPDGALVPACAQACPTDSIVFGDVSDANSAVSIAKSSDRNYAVFGYLNIRPRTTYLAKIRNPNPAITGPGESEQPLSRQEYDSRYGHKAGAEAAKPAGSAK
jgi:molybdopterin-containing oxidoreductase family iron-sulfur binding subunit